MRPLIEEAGWILFDSALFLGSFPFSFAYRPPFLSFEMMQRALFWGSNIKPQIHISSSAIVRKRTNTDTRRVSFDSFANDYVEKDPQIDFDAEKELAQQGSERRLVRRGPDYTAHNFDDDGDETYHGILEVFCWTQPERQH